MVDPLARFPIGPLTLVLLLGGVVDAEEPTASRKPQELRVYIGTYTTGASEGIYTCKFDVRSGRLSNLQLAAATTNPSFLALHPHGKYLFAVNEIGRFEGKPTGAISAYAIDRGTGKLTLRNQQSSGGAGPCHLIVDQAGKSVLFANYGGGSVGVAPIDSDGRLGELTSFLQHAGSSVNPQRQTRPHAHSINLDAANRFAIAADLGLDKLLIYRFNRDEGKLIPHDPASASVAPGAGPRHFDFHPNGRIAYVINELQSTITAFAFDADRGTLEELQTISTLPRNFEGNNSTADIHVHPSGRFVFGSNRGHDSIAIFAIDAQNGRLTVVGHQSTGGKTPRNFAIDTAGQWLLAENQATNTIVVFKINPQTGQLEQSGNPFEVPSPVCVQLLPLDG